MQEHACTHQGRGLAAGRPVSGGAWRPMVKPFFFGGSSSGSVMHLAAGQYSGTLQGQRSTQRQTLRPSAYIVAVAPCPLLAYTQIRKVENF